MEEPFENFVNSLKETSRKTYLKRVTEYRNYCTGKGLDPADVRSLDNYLEELHSKDDFEFAASTLWNIASICGSWFESVHNIKIFAALTSFKKRLKNWSKEDTVKKSAVFSLDQLAGYLKDAPNDDTHLVRKVALIVRVYGLTRKAELVKLEFCDVKCSSDNTVINMAITRMKQAGAIEKQHLRLTIHSTLRSSTPTSTSSNFLRELGASFGKSLTTRRPKPSLGKTHSRQYRKMLHNTSNCRMQLATLVTATAEQEQRSWRILVCRCRC